MVSVIIAIIVFSILVIAHEFGHYIAAKSNNILVEEFAVGMGPKIISKQFGETVYSLRAFPIGGFCKMLGEDEESKDDRALNNKSVKARIVVMVAGAFMNVVVAFLLLLFITAFTGYSEPVISEFIKGYNAETSGLEPNDKILSVNGQNVALSDDLMLILYSSRGKPMDVVVERLENGEKTKRTFEVQPIFDAQSQTYYMGFRMTKVLGLFQDNEGYEDAYRASVLNTAGYSFGKIGFYVRYVYFGLVKFISSPFETEESKDPNLPKEEMAGPIRIVQFMGDSFSAGVESSFLDGVLNVMSLAALISINLAVFNLLPFPALDGGRVFFLIIEGIRRKPINPDKEGIVHLAGFVLLMALMIFVMYNDIARIVTGA